MNQKTIDFNGKQVEAPFGLSAIDPNSGKETTYMPIYYVMQTLKNALSIKSTWNGTNWQMTLPSGMTPNQALQPVARAKGDYKNVYVNGVLVATVPSVAATDPASGKLTTYVPIWYVMQILKDVNVQSTWNGKLWAMMGGASGVTSITPVSSPASSSNYQDEKALILNLKNANNVLTAALNTGQLTASMYTTLNQRLQAISTRLSDSEPFHMVAKLQSAVEASGLLLKNNQSGNASYSVESEYQNAVNTYQLLSDQVASLSPFTVPQLSTLAIVIDGQTVESAAQILTQNNETYVSLYDAELLVKNITGDKIAPMQINDSTGQYNQAQQWDGATKTWDVAWEHSVPQPLGGQGSARLQLDGTTILRTDTVVYNVDSTPTVFVPVWTVQQLLNQMLGTTNTTDQYNGVSWTLKFNRDQQYAVSSTGNGIPLHGSGTSAPGGPGSTVGPINWWSSVE
jgi:hypothetical protein